MELLIILAAVALTATLRAIWIKKHDRFLGMNKKKTRPTKDGQR